MASEGLSIKISFSWYHFHRRTYFIPFQVLGSLLFQRVSGVQTCHVWSQCGFKDCIHQQILADAQVNTYYRKSNSQCGAGTLSALYVAAFKSSLWRSDGRRDGLTALSVDSLFSASCHRPEKKKRRVTLVFQPGSILFGSQCSVERPVCRVQDCQVMTDGLNHLWNHTFIDWPVCTHLQLIVLHFFLNKVPSNYPDDHLQLNLGQSDCLSASFRLTLIKPNTHTAAQRFDVLIQLEH